MLSPEMTRQNEQTLTVSAECQGILTHKGNRDRIRWPAVSMPQGGISGTELDGTGMRLVMLGLACPLYSPTS